MEDSCLNKKTFPLSVCLFEAATAEEFVFLVNYFKLFGQMWFLEEQKVWEIGDIGAVLEILLVNGRD